ncbi:MAG: phosphoribosyltransferase family protein [Coriobacteriia bacterium]|nr:phosphoribosyltransferase family protein [Coriobacteriia bacterium]
MFRDRRHAGKLLAEALRDRIAGSGWVVLGLPRGGVVVGAEVARALGLPLDVIVTRKIGAPGNPEYAIGAVDADGVVTLGAYAMADHAYVERAAEAEKAEIARRLDAYRRGRPPLLIEGARAIVVDDGLATGLTMISAVEHLKRHGAAHIVVAVPVSPPDTARLLRARADEVVTLAEPSDFFAVGAFYDDFTQTSDAEVIVLLDEFARGVEGE